MASDLADNVTDCLSVSRWDTENQSYRGYFVGGPPSFDFHISKGMAFFAEVDGGMSSGGLPHAIYGEAYHIDENTPAENATLNFFNVNTGKQFNTTVKNYHSGYYNEDLCNFGSSGWNHGDILRITAYGTGDYTGWSDLTEITLDNTTGRQQMAPLYLKPFNITLYAGWNLITIPLHNSWKASDLLTNISGCFMISWYDAENQTFRTATSSGGYDFQIDDGKGYFAYVTENSIFNVTGDIILNTTAPIETAWNMIGWYQEYQTTACNLMANIPDCIMGSWYDTVNETYRTATESGGYDFNITKGMGVFIYTTSNSTWYGEGSDGSGCGGKRSSNNSSSTGTPYPIYGYAYYKNQSNPAYNATITIINLNTSESFNSTIPNYYAGFD
jgi:hypothetical protein